MSNKEKLRKLLGKKGVITRDDAKKEGVSSSSFFRFLKDEELEKIAPGSYAPNLYASDSLAILQSRYPNIVYSYMTGLYLNDLTDVIPDYIEFTMPKTSRVRKGSIRESVIAHIENDRTFFDFGNVRVVTKLGHEVISYGPEKLIVELIRNRDAYPTEVFLKAIRKYLKRPDCNQALLLEIARMKNIEKKVFELMEIFINEDK